MKAIKEKLIKEKYITDKEIVEKLNQDSFFLEKKQRAQDTLRKHPVPNWMKK